MALRFYVDTSVWRDYFEDRRDNIRPLGEFAFRFLFRCKEKGCVVLFSELAIRELKRYLSDEQVQALFGPFEDILVKAKISFSQILEAEQLAAKRKESHYADILHAILARDNLAVLVSRDFGFESLSDLVPVKKPENVIFD